MIIGFLKRKFGPRATDEAGNRISRTWVGNDDNATLIDIESGKVLAIVRHDGCGKFDPTVFVSVTDALRLSRNKQGSLVSLLALPRFTMDLFTLRNMDEARDATEWMLDGGV
jgi:hypothetical protein